MMIDEVRFWTIEHEGKPVVVMSKGMNAVVPSNLPTQLLQAEKQRLELHEQMQKMAGRDLTDVCDLQEIDEALDTWLGADLGLHSDDRRKGGEVNIRKSTDQEIACWKVSRDNAVRDGNQEPDEDWLIFLGVSS